MAPFERLQELWQAQRGPAVSAEDSFRLMRSLQEYGRRQNYINAAKTAIILAVLTFSAAHSPISSPVVAGLVVVGAAAAALLIREWRSQRAIARLDFSAPSLVFVSSAIERLKAQRDPCRRYYWPFMGALVLGMNLMLTGTHRLWLRIIASGLPFLAFELGSRLRRKRFEVECRPLLNQLSAMRSAIEERVE